MLDATEIFPRRSRRSVVQRTDGYLRLVFSPHRSIPAFPTPLRRVIGHHWPWHRLARAICFSGRMACRSRSDGRGCDQVAFVPTKGREGQISEPCRPARPFFAWPADPPHLPFIGET